MLCNIKTKTNEDILCLENFPLDFVTLNKADLKFVGLKFKLKHSVVVVRGSGHPLPSSH